MAFLRGKGWVGWWFGKTESHSLSLPHPVHKSYGTFSSTIAITALLSQHIGLLGGPTATTMFVNVLMQRTRGWKNNILLKLLCFQSHSNQAWTSLISDKKNFGQSIHSPKIQWEREIAILKFYILGRLQKLTTNYFLNWFGV